MTMKIEMVSFYANTGGQLRLDEYYPFMCAAAASLKSTNPDARYIVLSDYSTANAILAMQPDFTVVPCAPDDTPLMAQYMIAQKNFIQQTRADMVVFADTDCLVNRSLHDALPDGLGLAITHKGAKFHYRINNVAYCRDFDLMSWFLDRSLRILEQWPREKWEWYGDQESWESALGVPREGNIGHWVVLERTPLNIGGRHCADVFLAEPEPGRRIYTFPCYLHNMPMSDDGSLRAMHAYAYLIHFKGDRKRHIPQFMTARFGL